MSNFNIFLVIFSLIVFSSLCVITVTNPVHSVFFLIITFIGASFLIILFEIDFVAFMLIIIYVGAIAVLFLFVVMMLDLKISSSKSFDSSLWLTGCLGLVGSLLLGYASLHAFSEHQSWNYLSWFQLIDVMTIMESFGQFIYTIYFFQIMSAGILLLIGMIGAIVLTLQDNRTSKNQELFQQLSRQLPNSIFKIEPLEDYNRRLLREKIKLNIVF